MKKLTANQINGIREWLYNLDDEELKTNETILKSFEENFPLAEENELDRYWLAQANKKLTDINQWSGLALSRNDLTPRVINSLLLDINNRTTD